MGLTFQSFFWLLMRGKILGELDCMFTLFEKSGMQNLDFFFEFCFVSLFFYVYGKIM